MMSFYILVNAGAFRVEEIENKNDSQNTLNINVTLEQHTNNFVDFPSHFSALHSEKFIPGSGNTSAETVNSTENWSYPTLRSGESLYLKNISLIHPNSTMNNGSQSSTTQCNKQLLLHRTVKKCIPNDYCCIINVYETQFMIENKKNNSSKSLEKCKISCKFKNSPVICNQNTNKNSYSTQLISCYENCFINEYKCKVDSIYNKVITTFEIVVISILLFMFAICFVRTTILKECNFEGMSSSSKVHVATTRDTFSDV